MVRAPPGRISWPRPLKKGADFQVAAREEEVAVGLGGKTFLVDLRDSRGERDMPKRDEDSNTDSR